MNMPNGMNEARVWPMGQPEVPPLVAFAYLTLTPILAIFVNRRGTLKWSTICKWPLARILVMLVLVDSLLFICEPSSIHETSSSASRWPACTPRRALIRLFSPDLGSQTLPLS